MKLRCPACERLFERLGQHWSRGQCSYPSLSTTQRAILEGIVLSGSSPQCSGGLQFSTTNELFAMWMVQQLDWMCQSVTEREHPEQKLQYILRTPKHPEVERFASWPRHNRGDGHQPPDTFELTPLAGRIWYAREGWLQWAGPWEYKRQACFSALYDERAQWIQRLLTAIDEYEFTPIRVDRRIQLSPSQTRDWLAWIGDVIPGVAYKWCESPIEYRALRRQPETEQEYRVALSKAAINIAYERANQPLLPVQFDSIIDELSAQQVTEWLDTETWKEALVLADVPSEAIPS